jgi:beta-glucosidase
MKNLDFVPNGFDVNKLAAFKAKGIPVVSVFLSGRPLWTNPEINNSDAFIAAFLPGSEGGGVADMLFQTNPAYDFKGTLSFTWPNTAISYGNAADRKKNALFNLGYGLNYASNKPLDKLSEVSGLENSVIASTDKFYLNGKTVAPWSLSIKIGNLLKQVASFPTSAGGFIITKTDNKAQEDALKLNWTEDDNSELRILGENGVDLSRQTTAALELAFMAKSFKSTPANVRIGMGCNEGNDCNKMLDIKINSGDWQEYRISLSCFANLGVDMKKILAAFIITASKGTEIAISDVRLESDIDARPTCTGK